MNYFETSTLLKQGGIILTENRTKGSRHPKKSFGMSLKKPGRTVPEEITRKLV